MPSFRDTDAQAEYTGTANEKVYKEAHDRFERCRQWESAARRNWDNDTKFYNADSYNGYQWPNELRKNRDVDAKPCLTINKTRQHCLQIINDGKQNKPSVDIRPTGNGATYESAQCLEGIVRHIEYISNAQVAYDTASHHQVVGGLGWIRVTTDYMAPDSFDQEIYIRRVTDPLTIYMDPEAKEADKSDSKFAFVFDDLTKEAFKKKWPQYQHLWSTAPLGADDGGWMTNDMVRVAEYWRIKETKDKVFVIPGVGNLLKSDMPKEMVAMVEDDSDIQRRPTMRKEVEWYLIIGQEVVQKKMWPGKYIPLIPMVGEETVIDGQMDRKGHVRALLDPQRMYNYWTSSAVEFVALQGKSPWLATAEAIEGREPMWNNANKINYSALIYNGLDDAGQPIPPPQRPQGPQMAPAYLQGMQIAGQELMYASGQYQAQMGEQGNERSGKAIMERQRQGDNATYHYIDNQGRAIRFLGKILLDLIPKIYDVQRVIMIMAEDGTDMEVQLNPSAAKAYMETKDNNNKVAQRIFNPNVGTYEVQADIGPAYATKREQAFDAMREIMTQAPALTSIIGDILFKAADFPNAEEVSMRLRRMVPPQALGDGPTQQEQMLQQEIQKMQGAMGKMLQELSETRLKLKAATGDTVVDQYKADTERLRVISDHMTDQVGLEQAARGLEVEMAQTDIQAHQANNDAIAQGAGPEGGSPGNQMQLPFGGPQGGPERAVRAPDGHYYIRDRTRNGKYLMVG